MRGIARRLDHDARQIERGSAVLSFRSSALTAVMHAPDASRRKMFMARSIAEMAAALRPQAGSTIGRARLAQIRRVVKQARDAP